MAVPSVNIQIDKGTDFSSTFDLNKRDNAPLDLTLYDFSAKMRKHAAAPGAIGFAATYGGQPAKGNLTISLTSCLLYTSPSPRDLSTSRMPSSA